MDFVKRYNMKEKQCKWFFPEQNGGRIVGPEDAAQQSFRMSLYGSLIRECIQNSLDAYDNPEEPVRVDITFNAIERAEYSNFFELSKHISGCLERFGHSEQAERIYGPVESYINLISEELGYVRIADSNTRGMLYDKNNVNSPFIAFVQSIGNSAKKDKTSGGSFGLGKAAYFAVSPIKTLLVSTKSIEDNKCYFQGVTTLCDNIVNGVTYQCQGYYCLGMDNSPIDVAGDIPDEFRREEYGTDFNIMGFDLKLKEEAKKEMVTAVLQNFWYAIYSKKLVVTIDGEVISQEDDKLDKLLNQYFTLSTPCGKHAHTSNPLPFYLAVKHGELDGKGQYRCYTTTLQTIGDVYLYLNLDKQCKSDRIMYMRKPKMLVQIKGHTPTCDVYGLFVCENDDGNTLLKALENASHTEWSASNKKDPVTGSIDKNGKKALEEIEEFIKICTNKVIDSMGSSVDVEGLDDNLANTRGGEKIGDKIDPGKDTDPGKGKDGGGGSQKPPKITGGGKRGVQRLKISSMSEQVNEQWVYTIIIYSTQKATTNLKVSIGTDSSVESVTIASADGCGIDSTNNILTNVQLKKNQLTKLKIRLSDNTMRYALKIDKV